MEEDEENDIVDKMLLMFFFDLKSTDGSTYSDCIGYRGYRGYPLVAHTFHDINAIAECKVGLSIYCNAETTTSFATMLEEYLLWIGDTVDKIDEWKGVKHYFLLVSHNGFVFDCTFLISELERRYTFCSGFCALNV